MITILTFFLLAIIVAFILSFPITHFLYKYKIVRSGVYDDTYSQIPSRLEKRGVPIMGGIIIIVTVLALNIPFNFNRNYTLIPLSVLLLCSIIGALDDILNIFGRKRSVRKLRLTIRLALHHAKPLKRIYFGLLIPWSLYKAVFYTFGSRLGTGLHPHEKIIVQTLAGIILAYWVYFKIHWSLLWLPGNFYIDIGWLLIPLSIFMVVFMANAVNVTDGMDGLSSGLLLSSFITFMIIAAWLKNIPIAELCATTAGALITYIYFNIKPARFEMGDVGSLALGAMLATIAIILHREFILFITGLPFIIEIVSVIIQKLAKKFYQKKVFRMAPLHHHFEMLGWKEEKVVMRFWIFSIFCVILSLLVSLVKL